MIFEFMAVLAWMKYLQPDHLQTTTFQDAVRNSLRRLSGAAAVSISPSAGNKSVSAAANATNTLTMQKSDGGTAEGHKNEAQVEVPFLYQVAILLSDLTFLILTLLRRSLPILLSKERHGSPFTTYRQKFRLSLSESTAPISSTTFTDLCLSASFCHCLRSF